MILRGQAETIDRLSKPSSYNQEYVGKLKRIQSTGINRSN